MQKPRLLDQVREVCRVASDGIHQAGVKNLDFDRGEVTDREGMGFRF